MGIGPIPSSVLRKAVIRLDLDEEEAAIFLHVMRSLDGVYQREVAKTSETEAASGRNGPATVSERGASVELFDALFG